MNINVFVELQAEEFKFKSGSETVQELAFNRL